MSKAQAIEAEILAGRYAQASTTLNSLPENTLSASHHITLQWLIDYLRWQPFGANWEELLLLPKLAADSTTQTPYDRWLKLLAATRERALGPDELEEQWRDLQQTNGGPIPTLMYLVSMRAPAEERYRIALKEAQASFPEANVFSHLELRANIQRGLTSAELQSLESAAVTPQSLRALVVDYALYMQRQERFAIAKRALKRTADKKAIYPESALALANLYSDSSEEHLRTQQFLMVMSDVISREIRQHSWRTTQRGRLSEAIKLWNFCLPAKDAEDSAHDGPEQTTVNPMQVACLEKKRFAALWFERTKQARATIEDGQRLSAKVATDAYVRRELAMTTIESQARLSLTDEKNPARFGVLRDEFNAIAARQPTSVAAIRGVYRLQQYALSVADSDRTLETLASRAQVPDAYRPCYELYDDAALSQRHAATKDGERRKQLLNSVVKGQCMQRKTYPFVRARAQLDLAEMYLNAGNRGDAQDILNTYAQAHTRADKDLIDQIRATQLKAKL